MPALTDEQFSQQSREAFADALVSGPGRPFCVLTLLTGFPLLLVTVWGSVSVVGGGDWSAFGSVVWSAFGCGWYCWQVVPVAWAATCGRRERVVELLGEDRSPFRRRPGLAEPAGKP